MKDSCPGIKASCKDSDLIKSMTKLIEELEKGTTSSIISLTKKEIDQTKAALNKYKIECNKCASKTSNDYRCHNAAVQNFQRRTPLFSKNVYPWSNYDWDYSNYVSNNYTPRYTGARVTNTISGLIRNVRSIIKVLNGLTSDPIPNSRSMAGQLSRNSDYPEFEHCLRDPKCRTIEEVKNSISGQVHNPPTKDKFLDKKRVMGKGSSSFYVKIGTCKRPDIKTEEKCEEKGYSWSPNLMANMAKSKSPVAKPLPRRGVETTAVTTTPAPTTKAPDVKSGSCSQPRYIFIDNSPKTFFAGANVTSMI